MLLRIVTTDGDPWVIQVLDSLTDTNNPTAIYNNCQHQLDNWHLLVLNFLEAVGIVNEEMQILCSARRWLQTIRKTIRWPDDALYSFDCLRHFVQKNVSPERYNSYDVYFQRLSANFPRWAFYTVKSTPGTRDSGANESEHLQLKNEGCRRDTPVDVSCKIPMNVISQRIYHVNNLMPVFYFSTLQIKSSDDNLIFSNQVNESCS